MALTGEPVTGAAADPLAAGQAGARFVRGGTLRVAAYALAISTSIVAMPFVTRHLHSGNYGRYVVVTSVMVIVAALTEGGIANLGVREYSQSPDPQRREFMRSLIGMRIALSVLGAAGALVFVVAAGFSPVVVEGTAIAGAGLVLAGLQITLTVPLTASLRLGWLAALDVITPGATALTLIVLVVLGAPLLPFYLSTVIAYGASLAVTAALVRHEVTLRPAFNLARWRSLLGDSAVFAAATAIGVVYFQVVVVVMALITNAEQTGIFSVAFRILSVVNGIPVVLVGSAFPILLRAAGDDRVRLRFVLGRLLEGSLLLGGWLSLLVVTTAPFAIKVIAGPGYPGASGVLRILGAGVTATFIAAVLAMTLLSVRAYRPLITISGAMIALAIVLCAMLIPDHGAHGAAIVTLALEIALAAAYCAVLLATHSELRPDLARSGRIALALGLAFVAALVPPLSPLLAALVGTVVLAAAAAALRALPVELTGALGARGRTV